MADQKSKSAGDEPSVEDLSRQLDELKADMAKLVETLGTMGRARGEHAAEDLRARAEDLRDKGRARAAEAEARFEELTAEAELMARERPAAAMGLAAGVGFLLGLILARR